MQTEKGFVVKFLIDWAFVTDWKLKQKKYVLKVNLYLV